MLWRFVGLPPSVLSRASRHRERYDARMPAEPLTRDAWVADFVHELLKVRPDLNGVTKFAHQVGHVEYPRQKHTAPAMAAKAWNERVKSARS